MVLYLRNKDNRSIVDIELNIKRYEEKKLLELHSSVIIDKYSELLLDNIEKKDEIINDFTEISDLRGWLWESFFVAEENEGTQQQYEQVLTIMRTYLKEIAKRYNLSYVED